MSPRRPQEGQNDARKPKMTQEAQNELEETQHGPGGARRQNMRSRRSPDRQATGNHRKTACTTAGPPIRRKSSLHHRQATGSHRKTACTTAGPPSFTGEQLAPPPSHRQPSENSLHHRWATSKTQQPRRRTVVTTALSDSAFRFLSRQVTESGPSARLELR